jgi:cell division septal protein FtsQ
MFTRKKSRSRTSWRGTDTPSITRHIIYGVLSCLLVALILTLVWYLTRLPFFTISTITVEGGETISHEEVRRSIEEVLNGSYMKVVPYRFTLMYPHDALIEAVQALPRVKSVELSREKNTELRVSFSEYAPYALWCAHDDGTRCYFLDAEGYAFAESPNLKGGTLIRHTYVGVSNLEKKQITEESVFRETHRLLERLRDELSLRVTDVRYTEAGDMELTVNGGGILFLRSESSYDGTFENLRSILGSESFSHLEPGNFQYIDLRFGNKVFVNEEKPVVATTTDAIATSTESE